MRIFNYSHSPSTLAALVPPPPPSDRQFHTQNVTIDVYFDGRHTATNVARIEFTVRCTTRTDHQAVDSTRFTFQRDNQGGTDLSPPVMAALEVVVGRSYPIAQKLRFLGILEKLTTAGSAGFTIDRIVPQHPYDALKARRHEPLVWSKASPRRVDDYLEGAIEEFVYFRSRTETASLHCQPLSNDPTKYSLIFEHGTPSTISDFSHNQLSHGDLITVLKNVDAHFRQGGVDRVLEFLRRDIAIVSRRKIPLGGTLMIQSDPAPSTTGGVVLYIKGAASTAVHQVDRAAVGFELSFPAVFGTDPTRLARELYQENATTKPGALVGAPPTSATSKLINDLRAFNPDVQLIRTDPTAFPLFVSNTVYRLRASSEPEARISFGVPLHLARYIKLDDLELLDRVIGGKRFHFTVENLGARDHEVAAIIVGAVDEHDIDFQMIDRYGRSCKGHLFYSGVPPFEAFKPDEVLLQILQAYLEAPDSVFTVCAEKSVSLVLPNNSTSVQSYFYDTDPLGECLLEIYTAKAELEASRSGTGGAAQLDRDEFVPLETIQTLGKHTFQARTFLTVGNHRIGIALRHEGQEIFICVYDQARNFYLSCRGSVVSIAARESENRLYLLVRRLMDIEQGADLSKAIPNILDQVFLPDTFPTYQNIGRFDQHAGLRWLWWLTRNYQIIHSVASPPLN